MAARLASGSRALSTNSSRTLTTDRSFHGIRPRWRAGRTLGVARPCYPCPGRNRYLCPVTAPGMNRDLEGWARTRAERSQARTEVFGDISLGYGPETWV